MRERVIERQGTPEVGMHAIGATPLHLDAPRAHEAGLCGHEPLRQGRPRDDQLEDRTGVDRLVDACGQVRVEDLATWPVQARPRRARQRVRRQRRVVVPATRCSTVRRGVASLGARRPLARGRPAVLVAGGQRRAAARAGEHTRGEGSRARARRQQPRNVRVSRHISSRCASS